MIKIHKPVNPPKVLKTKGKKKRKSHSSSYTKNKTKYDNGEKTFKFDSDIYGHKTVKSELKEAQSNKCCFCESKVGHIAYGDVEHFRPKAGFRQTKDDDLGRPGYYWLAYEWENLFFSCQLCNQRYKANLFPLENPNERARSHKDEITKEKPLFVNPAEDDPEELIKFRGEIVFPVDGNKRARITINELGLNRELLREQRYRIYNLMKTLWDLIQLNPGTSESEAARDNLNKQTDSSQEYASMARCAMEVEFEY